MRRLTYGYSFMFPEPSLSRLCGGSLVRHVVGLGRCSLSRLCGGSPQHENHCHGHASLSRLCGGSHLCGFRVDLGIVSKPPMRRLTTQTITCLILLISKPPMRRLTVIPSAHVGTIVL